MEVINCTVGVDVVGTNTDAVLLQENEGEFRAISVAKRPTTVDITSGIQAAIQQAISKSSIGDGKTIAVSKVQIGTTHLINAIVECKGLAKVSVVRLCGTASRKLPPFSDFPEHLQSAVKGQVYLVSGGYQCDGCEIDPVNINEITECIEKLKKAEERNIVVSGIYSPMKSSQEDQVVEMIAKLYPEASVTASHKIGKLGLLQRENAAIVNETLKPVFRSIATNIRHAVEEIGIYCPIFITQNDGTAISVETINEFPIRTFYSGITNCMKGASYLSSLTSFVCVDIGGSTTDVGMFVDGKPKECFTEINIGGIRMNCYMPDFAYVALGSGTYIEESRHESGEMVASIGQSNAGYDIESEALVFAKSWEDLPYRKVTATDIAVAATGVTVEHMNKHYTDRLSREFVAGAMKKIHEIITGCVDQIRTDGNELPLVLVGRGSILLDKNCKILNISEVVVPKHSNVASAVGAAISKTPDDGETKKPCVIDLENFRKISTPLGVTEKQTITLTGNPFLGSFTDCDREEPTVDPTTGEWLLSKYDIECISIGSGVMGCGGGGNPTIGKLLAQKSLRENKTMRVVNPSKFLNKCHPENDVVVTVAFMGAPSTLYEKLVAGNETIDALRSIEQIFDTGKFVEKDGELTLAEDTAFDKIVEEKNGVRYINNFKLDTSKPAGGFVQEKKIVALLCTEVGGMNSIEPLVVGAELGLPVLDCDGMGRAFPEVGMFAPFIYGSKPYPSALADDKGRRAIVLQAESPKQLETHLRDIVVGMGCCAGVVLSYFTKDEIVRSTVTHSMSHAWRIGDAIIKANNSKVSPVKALVHAENGKLLVTGRVVDIKRQATDGFNKGKLFIEGTNDEKRCLVSIDMQNEYLVAEVPDTGEILATVPDLITIVDSITARPIPSEELKIGMGVAVIVLPAPPLITSDHALKYVGPAAFGYPDDVKYRPVGTFVDVEPVCPCNSLSD